MPTIQGRVTERNWTLVHTSRAHAGSRPEHPAIVCNGRVTTYAKLHRDSNRAAHALRTSGIRRLPGPRM
jgi:acyl-CoA synthetase (AMP-forming)/AMP-acid ligase II